MAETTIHVSSGSLAEEEVRIKNFFSKSEKIEQ